MTRAVVGRLREAHATRTRVQFGCEFALESGSVVAVVGKARAASASRWSWSGPRGPWPQARAVRARPVQRFHKAISPAAVSLRTQASK
ncbi:hypothetical protein [Streptomyces collinus]|uniref:hypothetical protein n=1 Tax=Streptomyces collinus TaxID=42684 RepID=UPI0036BFFA79